MMLSPGNQRIFLFEGGRPKDGVTPNPIGPVEGAIGWMGKLFTLPGDEKPGLFKPRKSKDNTLRKVLEKKPQGTLKDDSPGKFDTLFLGQYPAWCHGLSDDACWCCEEAHSEVHADTSGNLWRAVIGMLIALTVIALLFFPAYCAFSGSCGWFANSPPIPKLDSPPSPFSQAETRQPEPPMVVAPIKPPPVVHAPSISRPPPKPIESAPIKAPPVPLAPPPPRVEAPKPPPMFHVAFFADKSNLTSDSMNVLASAASQSIQQNRTVNVRIFSLTGRETDDDLWRRRLYAVKDELVRLGVPANRIRQEGAGPPYLLTIRSNQPKQSSSQRQRVTTDVDAIPDPMAGD